MEGRWLIGQALLFDTTTVMRQIVFTLAIAGLILIAVPSVGCAALCCAELLRADTNSRVSAGSQGTRQSLVLGSGGSSGGVQARYYWTFEAGSVGGGVGVAHSNPEGTKTQNQSTENGGGLALTSLGSRC